MQVLEEPKVDS